MNSEICTKSEIEAYMLVSDDGSASISTFDVHKAGNKIIALAEQIKAERAIVSMK